MNPKVVFWHSGQYVDHAASFASGRDFLSDLFSAKIDDQQYAFECRSILDAENKTLTHWVFFPGFRIFMGHIRGYPEITDEKNNLLSRSLGDVPAEEIERLRSILAAYLSTYVPIAFANQRERFTVTKVVFEQYRSPRR